MTVPPPFWLKLTVVLKFAACPSTVPRLLLFWFDGMENEEDGRRGELERGTEVGHLSEDGYTFAGLCNQLDTQTRSRCTFVSGPSQNFLGTSMPSAFRVWNCTSTMRIEPVRTIWCDCFFCFRDKASRYMTAGVVMMACVDFLVCALKVGGQRVFDQQACSKYDWCRR